MNLEFENKNFVYLGIFFLLLILFFAIINFLKSRKKISRLGEKYLVDKLLVKYNSFRHFLKYISRALAVFLIFLAAANPIEYLKGYRKNVLSSDVVIVLDISNSMLADDIKPSRLEFAKQLLLKVLTSSDDRFGLVVYAGSAAIVQPLSIDKEMFKGIVRNIKPDYIYQQGTDIEQAVSKSLLLFDKDRISDRVILLITDGEDHEGGVNNIVKEIKDKNIKLILLGVGTKNGSPIPISQYNREDFKRDKDGNVVITRLDEGNLQDLAKKTKGTYIKATSLQQAHSALKNEFEKLKREESEFSIRDGYNSLYYIPLSLAIFLILFEMVLLDFFYFLIKK
ncbi:vWA domain-containing protein [Schleiferia thermophila]|uniref:Ca-activated chloride channel family protein n=1 Tax=Schleiferia thermophila TaxID=884107 RepID=A0A369A744_9FLAO|nr:VWA domain-containing protein [Schleiferia thermophila]RCX04985.1 Ca-activated chloride channel family protein [Schleiferia thermophila]GCD79497.1 membrane protein [Schleiferia thermophila]